MQAAMRIGAIAVVALLCANPAFADKCTISSSALVFGGYDVFDPAPTDSTGSVTYDCNGRGQMAIALLMPRDGSGMRALVRGRERLHYNLFLDAARTTVWGDASAGTQVYYVPRRGKEAETVPVFGRIPPKQDVAVGSYADTVTVYINF